MIYVIPLIIALVLITAMIKKLPSYEHFINGARGGNENSIRHISAACSGAYRRIYAPVRQARLTL